MQGNRTRDTAFYSPEDLQRLWEECLRANISQAGEIVRIEFNNEKIRQEISDLLYAILPLRGGTYPKEDNNSILITEDQYYFLQIYAMQQSGKISGEILGDQYLLKTLRDDDKDFSQAFISGIIPGPNGARYQNLRPAKQSLFTFSAQGPLISRLNKEPRHPEKKQGFSQIQSCTLIDKDVWSTPFGFSKARNEKLYGFMTHMKDTLIRGYLVKDSGTVARPFDFPSIDEAKKSRWYHKNKVDNKDSDQIEKKKSPETLYYPAQKFEEFKEHNRILRMSPDNTNEILARLRFNPHRSIVAICAETLEARLLAYKFADNLLEEFRRYAKQNGLNLNPNYRIPIIIYLPKKGISANPEFLFYTTDMRKRDTFEADEIYRDTDRRLQKFFGNETVHGVESSCNYDLLLGLKNLSDEHFNISGSSSVVLHMFEDGYIKRAIRLLGPFQAGNENNRCYRVINKLLENRHLDIAETTFLIVAEEFDIAAFVLQKTKLNKLDLKLGYNTLLIDHLIKRGNPRHFKFMGLEDMLKKAVDAEAWLPIKLCIKEFPQETRPLLGYLLFKACQQKRAVEVNFLLYRNADKTFTVNGQTPIVCSTELQDWSTLAIFARYSTDVEDHAHYGLALLEALRHRHRGLAKLLLIAGAKTTWRKSKEGYELESALFFALLDECDELSETVYNHEYLSKPCDKSTFSQLCLIRDLAQFKKQADTEKLLRKKHPDLFSSNPYYNEFERCVLVFEALAVGDIAFALRRMALYLCSKSSNQNTVTSEQFYECIQILNRNFASAIEVINKRLHKKIVENITLLTLRFQNLTLVHTIVTLFSQLIDLKNPEIDKNAYYSGTFDVLHDDHSFLNRLMSGSFDKPTSEFDIEMIIFNTLILNIDQNNFTFVQKVVSSCFTNPTSHERWQALILKALDEPTQHNISDIYKLHGLLYCTQTEPFRCLHFIFKNGYNQNLDSTITAFLDEIIQRDNYQFNFQAVLLNLWFYHPYYSNSLVTMLLSRLGANYVFHLTLLILKDILDYNVLALKQHQTIISIGKMRYWNLMLNFRGNGCDGDDYDWLCEKMDGRPRTIKEKINSYQDIMNILNQYTRNDMDPLLDETIRTFDSVLKIFNQIIANSKSPRLFSEHSSNADFNRKVFEYLSCVRDIIQAYELSASQKTDPMPNQANPPRYTLPTN